ncbi:hypothetical protein BD779DRAFT_1395239, partial [Infundibulicybe gibba]
AADFSRLKEKRLETSELLQSAGFSMTKDSAISGTGWQGKQLQVPDRKRLQEIYQSDEIRTSLAQFLPVYYDEYALSRPHRPFADLCSRSHERAASRERTRGPHFPCIMGHFRAYGEVGLWLLASFSHSHLSQYPELTRFHVDNASDAEAFINNPAIQHVTNAVSSCLKMMFPGVVRRLQASAEWYETHHHIKPQFGFFWNLCINGIFPGQKRIHSKPHADYKNVVGVCALLVYEIPGRVKFNHSKRTWLVLWEAEVAIQLPPWVVCLYPSSLLTHFNIDVHGA